MDDFKSQESVRTVLSSTDAARAGGTSRRKLIDLLAKRSRSEEEIAIITSQDLPRSVLSYNTEITSIEESIGKLLQEHAAYAAAVMASASGSGPPDDLPDNRAPGELPPVSSPSAATVAADTSVFVQQSLEYGDGLLVLLHGRWRWKAYLSKLLEVAQQVCTVWNASKLFRAHQRRVLAEFMSGQCFDRIRGNSETDEKAATGPSEPATTVPQSSELAPAVGVPDIDAEAEAADNLDIAPLDCVDGDGPDGDIEDCCSPDQMLEDVSQDIPAISVGACIVFLCADE